MTGTEWHLPFGATVLDGGQTRFRIWAPGQQTFRSRSRAEAPVAMTARAGGWFEVEPIAAAGTRYRYLLAGRYGRARSGVARTRRRCPWPEHCRRSGAYTMAQRRLARAAMGGGRLIRAACRACGGFAGVARELPRLAELGITAVELMPIAEFPGARNWGYDGVLPFAPECSYGTPGRLESADRCGPRARPDDVSGCRLQSFRAGRELSGALCAGVLSRRYHDAVGPGDRLPAAPRCGDSLSKTHCTG